MFKGCKAHFKCVEALRSHWAVEHDCGHSGCNVKSKNAGAGKEHARDRHCFRCQVVCQCENPTWWCPLLMQIHSGSPEEIVQDISTDLFSCPMCSRALETCRSIVKHMWLLVPMWIPSLLSCRMSQLQRYLKMQVYL